jgi:hypothetical protein
MPRPSLLPQQPTPRYKYRRAAKLWPPDQASGGRVLEPLLLQGSASVANPRWAGSFPFALLAQWIKGHMDGNRTTREASAHRLRLYSPGQVPASATLYSVASFRGQSQTLRQWSNATVATVHVLIQTNSIVFIRGSMCRSSNTELLFYRRAPGSHTIMFVDVYLTRGCSR